MKIFLLTSHLKERDGASRAIVNFAKGIKRLSNYEPVIVSLSVSLDTSKLGNIEVVNLGKSLGIFSSFRILLGSSSPLRPFKRETSVQELQGETIREAITLKRNSR